MRFRTRKNNRNSYCFFFACSALICNMFGESEQHRSAVIYQRLIRSGDIRPTEGVRSILVVYKLIA